MLNRLHSLQVGGFRPFRSDTGAIPLDADVVLVYGHNGAGKTGLISAIELALTGSVAHLECFEDDYPRCLRNTHQDKADVRLSYADHKGKLHQHHVTIESIDGTDHICHVEPILPHRERMLFLDRCYLSQYRLGRLLEIYQATPKGGEQHLVRFARELLGLDLLENLINGLHVLMDERRLKNAVSEIGLLQGRANGTANRISSLTESFKQQEGSWKAAIKAVNELAPNDSYPEMTAAGWSELIDRLSGAGGRKRFVQLQEDLHKRHRTVEASFEYLAALPPSVLVEPERLAQQLTETQKQIGEIQDRIRVIVENGKKKLVELKLQTKETPEDLDLPAELSILTNQLQRNIGLILDVVNERKQAQRTAALAAEELEELRNQLQRVKSGSASVAREARVRVALLEEAINITTNNNCPICGRDFSEVSPGGLIPHLRSELANLGVSLKAVEDQAKQRHDLEEKIDLAVKRIRTANARLAELSELYPNPDAIMLALTEMVSVVNGTSQDQEDLLKLKDEEVLLTSRIDSARRRRERQQNELTSLKNYAATMKIQVEPDLDLLQLVNAIKSKLDAQLNLTSRDLRRIEELVAASTNAAKATEELSKTKAALQAAEAELANLRSAERRASEARTTGQELCRAAQTVKARLIQEVFNEKLNTLCQTIYRRLVRVEAFDPGISEPKAKRGVIKAGIRAVGRRGQPHAPFQELASVLSASNLNTAALSLFLSLNLIENPKHRILMLDDPVQNMDDIHVIQLASLLRALARENGRQLVITVHERALFEYLALELGPSRSEDSLITLELSRDRDGLETRVKAERRQWHDDAVTFGKSGLQNLAS